MTYLRQIFSSPVDNVMAMRISADQPGKVNFTTCFTTPQSQGTKVAAVGGNTPVLSGTGGGTGPSGIAGVLPRQSRLRILPQGGTVSVLGKTLVVTNAHPYGSSICAGPTIHESILRDLFDETVRAATILAADAAFRTQLTNARARLVPFQIGAQGQLQEWKDDWDAGAPAQ